VTATNQQVKMMMKEMSKENNLSIASAKSGMSRQTAAKYYSEGKLPSELSKERTWQTRPCPFAEVWGEIESLLIECPGIGSLSIFNELNDRYDNRFSKGQQRTLQRKIKHWRSLHDSDERYEVFFSQRHRPGEAAQTDFTETASLNLSIQGQVYTPLLCHTVLPYSGWHYATPCPSESILSLKDGIQEAFFRLGKVPEFHQTDNSTAATHQEGKERFYNQEYLDLMEHLGMKPRLTGIGKKEQNGSVEAMNGVLKRFLNQQLILRKSRDFESDTAFKKWLHACLQKSNTSKQAKLKEELLLMKSLLVKRMPAFRESRVRVTRNSTITISNKIYSVPPRLIGLMVDVRSYKDKVDVLVSGNKIQSTPRLKGKERHLINYTHVIWSLVKKPGAFERYIYRDCLFPSLVFRRTYEKISDTAKSRKTNKQYLKILHFAASYSQSDTEIALDLLLSENRIPDVGMVKELVLEKKQRPAPKVAKLEAKLDSYDELISGVAS
jgi:hypothetical protein